MSTAEFIGGHIAAQLTQAQWLKWGAYGYRSYYGYSSPASCGYVPYGFSYAAPCGYYSSSYAAPYGYSYAAPNSYYGPSSYYRQR